MVEHVHSRMLTYFLLTDCNIHLLARLTAENRALWLVLATAAGVSPCLTCCPLLLTEAYLLLSCNGWLSIRARARGVPKLNCSPDASEWLSLRWDGNLG
jgi:hypothetical protein